MSITGNTVSRKLILGCMGLGGGWNTNPVSQADENQASQAINAALEAGINTFDHADIYAFGKAEAVFGRVLASQPDLREAICLQSKTGISLQAGENGNTHYNLGSDYIVNQTLAILQRLQTGYLDTLLLHRPDPLMRSDEIAAAFEWLHTRGLVRSFGVSNMHREHIRSISEQSPFPIIANQLQFSLGHRLLIESGISVNQGNTTSFASTDGLLTFCHNQGIEIQAWSPLDKGLFLNREGATGHTVSVINKVEQLAGNYQVAPEAVLLAWLYALPGKIAPVIGTTRPDRIKACAASTAVNLTREEWYDLWIAARGIPLP